LSQINYPIMRSSGPISLFSQQPYDRQQPITFLASVAIHFLIALIAYVGFVYSPRIRTQEAHLHLVVRKLELQPVENQNHTGGSGGEIGYPGPIPGAKTVARAQRPAAPRPAAPAAARPAPTAVKQSAEMARPKPAAQIASNQVAQLKQAPVTLIQPNVPETKILEIPVPTVVIWTPEKVPVKTIVPPQPHPATAADIRPSIAPPNQEVNLGDIPLSSSELGSKQPLLPTTTSPIVVHGPQAPQLPPATATQTKAQPTPAAVVALSDVQMNEGVINLPPANQTAASKAPGPLMAGHQGDAPRVGTSNDPISESVPAAGTKPAAGGTTANSTGDAKAPGPAAKPADPKPADNGVGKSNAPTNTASAPPKPGPVPAVAVPAPAPATATSAGLGNGSGNNSGNGNSLTTDRIELPQNGRFGAVVVGASLDAKYPEAAELWGGRMAYTVYLHVGLVKSWILQYSLTRTGDASAGGTLARLDAPWPFSIVRPNLAPGSIDADALMIHGIVNAAGRFENLAIVFPQQFAEAGFVLGSLQQWQFRPATLGGQAIPVEVILIIPDIEE
jgi:hypothetical protein